MKTRLSILITFFVIITSFAQDKKWTLKECVDHALEHNLSVKRAGYTAELRKEDITTAKGNFLPGASASASQNFNFGSFFDPSSNSRVSRDNRSNNFSLNASVTLFNGFSNKNSLLQSKTSYEASKLDLEKMKNDISLNIVNSYLNVLFNKENLKIAQAQVVISKQQFERTEELVDAGVQPKGNLLEVEATKVNDENSVVTAENNLALSLLDLSQLLQIPNQGFDVEEIPVNINSVALLYNNTAEIFSKAVENQPEIKSAELALQNSETGIKIAKANYLPTLSLNAGMNTVYSHRQGFKDDVNSPIFQFPFFDQLDNNFGQFYGFNLNVPIFNRGQVKANVNRAKINQEISQVNLDDTKRALREAVERAYINAKATLKEYEAAEKSVKAQEQSFTFAQERYSLGATNSFDFEQVRNRLVNAQSSLIRAKYNFVFRTKLLEFYYGIPIVVE
ncbi:MAG: TolC family protein [Flavobacteriaceae bacterium]|nr:TolC family protein [Flavobacteriaceae bacterium]